MIGFTGFMLSLSSPHQVIAEDLAIGLSTGLSSQAQEKGFSGPKSIIDLHFDYGNIRLGVNKAQSTFSTSLYGYNWPVKLNTVSYYTAMRFGMDQDALMYVLGGLLYQNNTLSLGNGVAKQKSQSIGGMVGAGYLFDVKGLLFGPQWVTFIGQSKFNDIVIATGSSQLQVAALYRF